MTELGRFDPTRCDLCGASDARTIIHPKTGRALRSDRVLLPQDLHKIECIGCGLVRSGDAEAPVTLGEVYLDEYSMSTEWEDHVFYTAQGPLQRSVAFADWLERAAGRYRWDRAKRILEIGAGAGTLLAELTSRYPESAFEGVEVNRAAAEIARRKGLRVADRLDDINGPFDLVLAVAVIEHVPSPARFLAAARRLLAPGGLLYLCQPTQDVSSYDLFFVDHLHHFASEHLRAYAGPIGFMEVALVVGHEVMPNFSLHVWQAFDAEPPKERPDAAPDGSTGWWVGPPVATTCATSGHQIQADMARLDATLADLHTQSRPVAVFGVNEAFWLTCAYSSLSAFPIACGLDDRPGQLYHARLPFPVVQPEQCSAYGARDVLLTMNALYYPLATRRLKALGLRPVPIFMEGQDTPDREIPGEETRGTRS
jgi:SAM-dependent methyltransferase